MSAAGEEPLEAAAPRQPSCSSEMKVEGEEGGDGECLLTCAICFCDVEHRTELPCNCTVAYCAPCWDQALARSFQVVGCAQCPTCRAAVRVDFDPSKERLVFTRDDETNLESRCSSSACQMRIANHQKRLAMQAQPVLIQHLRRFGQALPPHLLVSHSDDTELEPSTHAEICAIAASGFPRCICGASLQRLSAEQRASLWCRQRVPELRTDSPRFAQLLLRAQDVGISYCDMCDASTPPGRSVWTCSNGDRTIMHANAFDICDACFVKHACVVVEAGSDGSDLVAAPDGMSDSEGSP